jgi:hypothetical protein
MSNKKKPGRPDEGRKAHTSELLPATIEGIKALGVSRGLSFGKTIEFLFDFYTKNKGPNDDQPLQSDRLPTDVRAPEPDVSSALAPGDAGEARGSEGTLPHEADPGNEALPAIPDRGVGGDPGSGPQREEGLPAASPTPTTATQDGLVLPIRRVRQKETLASALGRFVKCSTCGKRANCVREEKPYCSECALFIKGEETPDTKPLKPVVLGDCEQCDNRRFLLSEVEGKTVASRCLACKKTCGQCNEVGLVLGVRGGYEVQIPCPCGRSAIERTIRSFNLGGFPGVYKDLLFGKLPPKAIEESQRQAHLLSWQWARRFDPKTPNKEKGFFFSGPAGTGKTLALCRALALIAKNTTASVRYINFPVYLDSKKDSWNNEEVEVSTFSELAAVDVLVVDEILLKNKNGAPRSFSDWERNQFNLLVNSRWEAGKATFFATNYRPDQIENEVPESTWSRIKSTCEFLDVQGADLRNGELIDINKRRGLR